jgi:hypothetical protein
VGVLFNYASRRLKLDRYNRSTQSGSFFQTACGRERRSTGRRISGESHPCIDCIRDLGSVWAVFCNRCQFAAIKRSKQLTRISLITVHIELIGACRCFDMLIRFDGIHPGGPASACVRIRPATVGLQNPTEADNPGCNFDVDKGEIRPKEKWPLTMSGDDKLVEAR